MFRVAFVCVLIACSPVLAQAPGMAVQPVCDNGELIGVVVDVKQAGRWLVWTGTMCRAAA